MQLRRLHCSPDLHLDLDAIRSEFDLPGDFPAPALAEADELAPRPAERRDATAIELVTIDPEGSRDLDQAVALERRGSGWRPRPRPGSQARPFTFVPLCLPGQQGVDQVALAKVAPAPPGEEVVPAQQLA